ncbi:hypothetical protein HYT95_02545, partial [Candidatus Peregrinibacteria bacterium]|nr:hypothetical protein [Candidatus Peregrinibacteria bacterium]
RDIQSNSQAIIDVERRLTERIDALDEDLTATMKDLLRTRQFVGMPVATED